MPSKRRRRTLAAAAAAAADALPARVGAGYPQLVERLMPVVYSRRLIELTSNALRLGLEAGGRTFFVLDPDLSAGETLTPRRREAILAATRQHGAAKGINVCVVFAPEDRPQLR